MFIMESSTNGFFDGVPSRTSFTFGVITGVAVVLIVSYLFGLPGTSGTSRTNARFATDEAGAAPTVAPAPTAQPSPTAAPTGPVPVISDDDHVRGNPNAQIAIIEYSDFECPFCGRFHPTMQQVLEAYPNDVKWVYRHFPLSFHPQAQPAAVASECINELGGNDAFWAFADEAFANQGSLGTALYEKIAQDQGIDLEAFRSCVGSGKYTTEIAQELSAGQAAGVTGTPGSFLIDANGQAQLISGAVPYVQVQAVIDAALNSK